jgi:hypothetical protein
MSENVIVTSIILSLALYEDITIEHKARRDEAEEKETAK